MKQIASGVNVAPTKVQEKIDVARLHSTRVGGISFRIIILIFVEKEDIMIDGGDGKVEIWRIEDNTKVPVPKVINKSFTSHLTIF